MTHRLAWIAAFVVLPVGSAIFAGEELTVLTQNQYLGADLDPVVTASDPWTFNAGMVAALRQIAANSFPERAQALAAEIVSRRPHLVGLQEVFSFGCRSLVPGACENFAGAGAFQDHLSGTLAALAEQGGPYHVAAVVMDLNLPGVPIDLDLPAPGSLIVPDILVSVLDRDVILARDDVTTAKVGGHFMAGGLCGLPVLPPSLGVSRPSADGCNFAVVAVLPGPLGTITIQRGFVAVDATVGDRRYRFANTHLEVEGSAPIVQALQAADLVTTLRFLTPPSTTLVLAGDINSSPEDQPFLHPAFGPVLPPYRQLVAAGFADAWDLRSGRPPGRTCCQAADLSNPESIAAERIDVIFAREMPAEVRANTLGNDPEDRTVPSRLWPSDHAAVVGTLAFD
jgi:endonuclease/exonuclease/phosphatase family metal-dependent hydrolase